MHDILQQLGISDKNGGVSTGKSWLQSSGKVIESYSPVDGRKIGEVTAADHSVSFVSNEDFAPRLA